MAKLLAADASWAAANACLDTHGGFGFAEEYDIERKFRETRLYQVAPGLDEPDPRLRRPARPRPAAVVLAARERQQRSAEPVHVEPSADQDEARAAVVVRPGVEVPGGWTTCWTASRSTGPSPPTSRSPLTRRMSSPVRVEQHREPDAEAEPVERLVEHERDRADVALVAVPVLVGGRRLRYPEARVVRPRPPDAEEPRRLDVPEDGLDDVAGGVQPRQLGRHGGGVREVGLRHDEDVRDRAPASPTPGRGARAGRRRSRRRRRARTWWRSSGSVSSVARIGAGSASPVVSMTTRRNGGISPRVATVEQRRAARPRGRRGACSRRSPRRAAPCARRSGGGCDGRSRSRRARSRSPRSRRAPGRSSSARDQRRLAAAEVARDDRDGRLHDAALHELGVERVERPAGETLRGRPDGAQVVGDLRAALAVRDHVLPRPLATRRPNRARTRSSSAVRITRSRRPAPSSAQCSFRRTPQSAHMRRSSHHDPGGAAWPRRSSLRTASTSTRWPAGSARTAARTPRTTSRAASSPARSGRRAC